MAPYSSADLVITPDGRIYHLDLLPSELAADIIIVGDPDRVPAIARTALTAIEVERFHRGLRTMTGRTRAGRRLSIVTSGMGTPSLEIVLGELAALNEIDFQTRRRKDKFPRLTIIRVGTSGGLQDSTPLGIPIITKFAVGLDNTGLFYEVPPARDTEALERLIDGGIEAAMAGSSRFRGKIHSYAAEADAEVSGALCAAAEALSIPYRAGITVSNSGFFANQGRNISRVPPSVPEIDRALAVLQFSKLAVENFEMEASLLLHLSRALGYRAGAICATVANRATDTFAGDIPGAVEKTTAIALKALELIPQSE